MTEETLLALINLIYEAACDPTKWPEFLSAFACAVEGRGTLIYTHNFETMDASTAPNGGFPNAVVGFDPAFLNSLEHYNHVNVWAQNETVLQPWMRCLPRSCCWIHPLAHSTATRPHHPALIRRITRNIT